MTDETSQTNYLKEIGEAFKLGSGVLGKSAIAVGILMMVGGVAVYRLKSDSAILVALGIIAIVFFLWFFPVIRFVEKHPDAALLEGAEWTGFHRFQAAAKGYVPSTVGEQAPLRVESGTAIVITGAPKPNEEQR